MIAFAATGEEEPEPLTAPTTTAATTTSSTFPPSGFLSFDELGVATVLPADWVIEQELNRHGDAALLYDAGDTAALVIIGRADELDEPITTAEPSEIALAVSRQLASFFFDEGVETVTIEAASVEGAEAATAQIRLDHEDGTHTVTRTTVIVRDGEAVYASLAYQGEFPPERIAQGLEVLERLVPLDI